MYKYIHDIAVGCFALAVNPHVFKKCAVMEDLATKMGNLIALEQLEQCLKYFSDRFHHILANISYKTVPAKSKRLFLRISLHFLLSITDDNFRSNFQPLYRCITVFDICEAARALRTKGKVDKTKAEELMGRAKQEQLAIAHMVTKHDKLFMEMSLALQENSEEAIH